MGYKLNGVHTGGAPLELMEAVKQGFKVDYFIEGGTSNGESVYEASKLYAYCHTVELEEGKRIDYPISDNVTLYFGDTTNIFPNILKKIPTEEYVMYWLDAHYCGAEPVNVNECPILEEIDIIGNHSQKSIIFIDDARLFLGATPYPHNPEKWASFMELFLKLHKKFPKHQITVVDDYILCIPVEMKANLNQEWTSNFKKRYP